MLRTAAFLLFLLALTASAAPVPKHLMKEPVLYHPVEPGAKWVYQFYSVDDQIGREDVEVVIAVREPKGASGVKVAELGSIFDGKTQTSGCYTAVSPAGLVEGYMSATGYFVPRTETLRVSAEPGTSWEVKVGEGRTGRTEKHTFRGEEIIDVPVGRFRALRVDSVFLYNNGEKQVWHRWYAPGLGLVKFEDVEGRRKVLKEFTAGSK